MDKFEGRDEGIGEINANRNSSNEVLGTELKNKENKRKNRYLGNFSLELDTKCYGILISEIAFMACVSGGSLLFGFSSALATAKKKDVNAFDKGISIVKTVGPESGGSLAMRALMWGTVYACAGFGLLCFTVWKAMGVNDLKEFRQKAGSFLPRLTPTEASEGRTEFSSLRDLLQYIVDESDKMTKTKNQKDSKID